jgi:hypothetical protein
VGANITPDTKEIAGQGDVGAFASYHTTQGEVIEVKSGISLVSLDQARLNLDREMRKRRSALLPLLKKGEELLLSTPEEPGAPWETVGKWISEVKCWTADTRNFLDRHSPNASSVFMSIVPQFAVQRAAQGFDGRIFAVSGRLEDMYQLLQTRLGNLRRIIEQPEAYF